MVCASVLRFQEAVVTTCGHGAGKIDAWHMRIGADKPAKAIQAQPVLVVDGRIFDSDIDLAIIWKAIRLDFLQACGYRIVFGLFDN